jgi:HD superfamily phosphohydrolase
MLIKDKVYGEFEINEPILLELINSKPVQRLKKIYNAGLIYKVLPHRTLTRYEHSIGVMLLLRSKGANLEEQIAGLLHDTPHTAFSHVVDFVFDNENQDYHEDHFERIIMNSEIPSILEKYGFDVKKILDIESFSLLEKSSPDLCADRIDYSLKHMLEDFNDQKRVFEYYESMVNNNGELVFDNKEVAKKYSIDFLEMVQRWADPRELIVQVLNAKMIKIGLENNIISEDDLFLTDDVVLDKLVNSKNKEINEINSLLNPDLKFVYDEENYEFRSKEKNRFVDPKVLPELKRVSDIYPDFLEKLEEHNKILSKEIFVRIEK